MFLLLLPISCHTATFMMKKCIGPINSGQIVKLKDVGFYLCQSSIANMGLKPAANWHLNYDWV